VLFSPFSDSWRHRLLCWRVRRGRGRKGRGARQAQEQLESRVQTLEQGGPAPGGDCTRTSWTPTRRPQAAAPSARPAGPPCPGQEALRGQGTQGADQVSRPGGSASGGAPGPRGRAQQAAGAVHGRGCQGCPAGRQRPGGGAWGWTPCAGRTDSTWTRTWRWARLPPNTRRSGCPALASSHLGSGVLQTWHCCLGLGSRERASGTAHGLEHSGECGCPSTPSGCATAPPLHVLLLLCRAGWWRPVAGSGGRGCAPEPQTASGASAPWLGQAAMARGGGGRAGCWARNVTSLPGAAWFTFGLLHTSWSVPAAWPLPAASPGLSTCCCYCSLCWCTACATTLEQWGPGTSAPYTSEGGGSLFRRGAHVVAYVSSRACAWAAAESSWQQMRGNGELVLPLGVLPGGGSMRDKGTAGSRSAFGGPGRCSRATHFAGDGVSHTERGQPVPITMDLPGR